MNILGIILDKNANNKGFLPGLVGASDSTHIVYIFVDLSAVANLAKVEAASTGPGGTFLNSSRARTNK